MGLMGPVERARRAGREDEARPAVEAEGFRTTIAVGLEELVIVGPEEGPTVQINLGVETAAMGLAPGGVPLVT